MWKSMVERQMSFVSMSDRCECGCIRNAHGDDLNGHKTACFGCAKCWEFKEKKHKRRSK